MADFCTTHDPVLYRDLRVQLADGSTRYGWLGVMGWSLYPPGPEPFDPGCYDPETAETVARERVTGWQAIDKENA